MKILSAAQIRAWDAYTIQHEPISSIGLMERAALACVNWILRSSYKQNSFIIFCGKGNNGGDGLAIARLLHLQNTLVTIYILDDVAEGSNDYSINLKRVQELIPSSVHFIKTKEDVAGIDEKATMIDALFGTGLNRPLTGLAAYVVNFINSVPADRISIDLPSGLLADSSSKGFVVIKATHTLTFQCMKLALLMQENASYIGHVQVVDIALHPDYNDTTKAAPQLVELSTIKKYFKPRSSFAHKGNFGQALLAGGSYGKMGAMVLAAKACLHAGAGLTTLLIPECGYIILQTSVPEAMVMVDSEYKHLTTLPSAIEKYAAIGIGPGMGTHKDTEKFISFIVRRYARPLVIDADALNCLAQQPALLSQLPPYSILTPHPKEFDRLFGEHQNDFDRFDTAKKMAAQLTCVIVLKSHHTCIALPDGEVFFNSTGNEGMAKGGSGDVLTGTITALLAQGYSPAEASIFGVYLHGWAGDIAAVKYSKEAMLPSHLMECYSETFLNLELRLI